MSPFVVAEITRDHLYERWFKENRKYDGDSQAGRLFTYEALENWWDFPDEVEELHLTTNPNNKTKFKLYDDDDELYYSGWLYNDDQCIVQQFVLKWAEADSGCTTILIHNGSEYVQEIG